MTSRYCCSCGGSIEKESDEIDIEQWQNEHWECEGDWIVN